MNETVLWILELKIKTGHLDPFKSLMAEMIDNTKENEPGTYEYEWHLSEDMETCHISERYADSNAAMVHLKTFGAQYAERFMALAEPTRFVIYGHPNEDVKAALSGFGATFMQPLGGFTR